jgi:hypothetical protein
MPMCKIASSFIVAALAAAGLVMANAAVRAQDRVVVPGQGSCDFITGGGFVQRALLTGPKSNFGAHGGCKQGQFWGQVNFVDHAGSFGTTPYHVKSIDITAYFIDPLVPNARNICGTARTNADDLIVDFYVRMVDGDPGPDRFGIHLSNGYVHPTSPLGGGNIELHQPNPSTTGPLTGTCAADLGPPPDGEGLPDAP